MMKLGWRLAIVCLLLAGCAVVHPGRQGVDGAGNYQAGGHE